MSTSQKLRNFVTEPIGDKLVTELPGIGLKLGERLQDKGFDKANVVLGQFLLLKCDEELFKDWLRDSCGANAKQSDDCYVALKEWCASFIF
ncbi:barrier-to-autointegration factor [Paragonimus westermani]|uniref:Barrier-to-autointegration factor-like protein n=1 Tax=Paragonimus westermani TaxID=34504 RepID=A0A5J4N6Y2_9TREM|nr:barrier-to-autointegration factor [Paragonimus westermani]KAA3671189.1 barrier-to-autointegration factor [Paragonimus westermani]